MKCSKFWNKIFEKMVDVERKSRGVEAVCSSMEVGTTINTTGGLLPTVVIEGFQRQPYVIYICATFVITRITGSRVSSL